THAHRTGARSVRIGSSGRDLATGAQQPRRTGTTRRVALSQRASDCVQSTSNPLGGLPPWEAHPVTRSGDAPRGEGAMTRTARAPPRPAERRGDRRAAVGDAGTLGWRLGGEFRTTPVALMDVGWGGAQLIAAVAPPARLMPVEVRLDGRRATEWA